MQLGRVVGKATATMKHASMNGWPLLVVQPLDAEGIADGEPHLVVDELGAGTGDLVLVTTDGAAAHKLVGDDTSPVQWFVMGIADQG